MEKKYIDLFTLQARLKSVVEGLFPQRLWVKADRLPSAPATNSTAAIDAAMPVQIVATGLLINCIVS